MLGFSWVYWIPFQSIKTHKARFTRFIKTSKSQALAGFCEFVAEVTKPIGLGSPCSGTSLPSLAGFTKTYKKLGFSNIAICMELPF